MLDQNVDLKMVVELLNYQKLETIEDISRILQSLVNKTSIADLEDTVKSYFDRFEQLPLDCPGKDVFGNIATKLAALLFNAVLGRRGGRVVYVS